MLQIVCIPYSNHGTVLHYESQKEFTIDYTRLDFGVFAKEDELNDEPYALTWDYVHDHLYHYNYADFFANSDDEDSLDVCKSIYFKALAQIAKENQLRIFYSSHGFDKGFINQYSNKNGTEKTKRFFEIESENLAELLTEHFDLLDFDYGFMCDAEHVPQLMSLMDQEEYGSPRSIPCYKPHASESILNQMAPEAKLIAFVVKLDYLCHTLLLKNIEFHEVIAFAKLKEANDILVKL